ncbi:MAG: hypothetical protein ACRD2A_08620 [Vicinamibacterales bacterium]
MTIVKIGVGSAAKVSGALYAGIGLFFGVCMALVSFVGSGFAATMQDSGVPFLGALFGVGAVIFLPLMYGFFGFIGGALGAFIFNLAAGFVGGLEIETR